MSERPFHIERYPVQARTIHVVDIQPLGSDLTRITFESPQLDHSFPYPNMAPVDHVKLLFPDESGELIWPIVTPEGIRPRGDGRAPVFRDYTVRHVTNDHGPVQVSIDFVLHDHGPAGRWAIRAKNGDELGMLGPRGSKIYQDSFSRYLLLADLTAAPALGRWLESVPPRASAQAWVFTADEVEEYPVASLREGAWRFVADPAFPADSTQALDLLAAAEPTAGDFVWVAGEAGWLKPIRRYLRDQSGLARSSWEVDGYWKVGESNLDHHAADGDD